MIWRGLLLSLMLMQGSVSALEGLANEPLPGQLDARQSQYFRAWFTRIVDEQVRRPSPRWVHRDCAGLIRYAAAEALAEHDEKWLRANGLTPQGLPPPLELSPEQQNLRFNWRDIDGQNKADRKSVV